MSSRVRGTLGGIAVLVGLCTLPARGHQGEVAPEILYALTSIDTVFTKQDLEAVLASPNEVAQLRELATGNYDFGLRLRAIRAIPHFCAEQAVECRDAILAVLDYVDADDSRLPGQKILRLRAAIEALGAARTGHPEDVMRLVAFLSDGSRDLRVAAIRALRDLCDPAAIEPLRRRLIDGNGRPVETVKQVQLAIDEALTTLAQCGP
ncbi:MAG TPA: HEAT repeat domain-containing protein [Kofleriaceae bacterium]|nr:HEAT repeat domain-containing protein [Kofleriaceae bacterium]